MFLGRYTSIVYLFCDVSIIKLRPTPIFTRQGEFASQVFDAIFWLKCCVVKVLIYNPLMKLKR